MNYKPDRLKDRDDRYNNHHRYYGYLPSQDADMIIYDTEDNALVLLEMKHFNSKGENLDLKADQHRRHAKMADRLGIPYLVVYYVPDSTEPNVLPDDSGEFWEFKVYPRNQKALESLPRGGVLLSDHGYCELLYRLSGVNVAARDKLSRQTSDLCWSTVKTDW